MSAKNRYRIEFVPLTSPHIHYKLPKDRAAAVQRIAKITREGANIQKVRFDNKVVNRQHLEKLKESAKLWDELQRAEDQLKERSVNRPSNTR